MAETPNIPPLSQKVDPEVRRAFGVVKAWFTSIGKLMVDVDLVKTGLFRKKADGSLVARIALGDPDYLLEILAGEVSEDQLTEQLSGRIDLVDAPVTGLVYRIVPIEEHVGITSGNPHGTEHAMLLDVAQLDPADSNTTEDKHLSNAQAKIWQDHVQDTDLHHESAEASTDVTVTSAGTAGVTYTATEQAMLNSLIADVGYLATSLNDLKAKLRAAGTLAS